MRKVKFKRWIPVMWSNGENNCLSRPIEGTGCFESEYTHDGIFHCWANAHVETDNGIGNYTVGIIELPDGTIEEVLPKNIKFVGE
jgi:hypothetical protein